MLDVRLGRPWDVSSGRPRDGQIGSLGDVLETLEGEVLGTSWGSIFADLVDISLLKIEKMSYKNIGIYNALQLKRLMIMK